MTEPDSLVYQENIARSKPFVVPLIIGAIWGWLTRPIFTPFTLHPSCFEPDVQSNYPGH